MHMVKELLGIQKNMAKADRTDRKVQNLASYINKESLLAIHKEMDGKKGKGIDGISKEAYEVDVERNIENLVKRMKNGSYKPNPIKRIYIPKDGSNKMRPLGLSCYEDKLVEQAIAQIVSMIYEPKFHQESYGFRPGRNCHQAVREVVEKVQYHKVSYVVDADIKSFFDQMDHGWLMKFLEHEIADKKFLELIEKFLKAGIMEEGKYRESDQGSAQGNGASPVLANIYLHYVLDDWFEIVIKRKNSGESYMVRYCDDFVCCFGNKREAEECYQKLQERFHKYGLELAKEKTKIIEFGRFAKENRERRGEGKPETFDFLGFTFYCSIDSRKTFFRCKVKTSKKKLRSKIKAMKEWIKNNRTKPLKEVFEKVNAKLRGHYQYYAVTDNTKEIKRYQEATIWLLYKWLNRRSQKRSYTIETFFGGLLQTFPIIEPKIRVSLYCR